MVGNFVESTREAVRTGLCNYLTFVGKGRSWVNELSPVDLPDFGEFWNRVLCDRNESLPPTPPQFTGGQCPGVEYDVFFTFDYRGTQGPNCTLSTGSRTRRGLGPVQGVFVTAEDSPNPDRYNSVVTTRFADGDQVGPATFTEFECDGYAVTGVTVTRVDGQPDDCGDPPPVVEPFPPQGDTINIDVTYTNNEGDIVTELGDFNLFAPIVIAPVTIVAPIRVNLPDVSFNGQIVLSPEFEVDLFPPSFDKAPGVVGEESEPPPEDSKRELLGVRVRCGNPGDTQATRVFGVGNTPDLWVPRLASVFFEVRVEDVVTRSRDYDLKQEDQFFPVPDKGLVTRFFVIPVPGASVTSQAVYKEPEVPPAND